MTLSVWRYAHLVLAIMASLFLLLASVTGIILAIDAIGEKRTAHKMDGFESVTLAQSIPELRKKYSEISEVTVNYNGLVLLKAMDDNGDDFEAYVNPLTGDTLGVPQKKTEFINWVTSLHRSLFLHETGRLIMGIASFILCLITVSGIVLVVQRQQKLKRFFAKVVKDNFAQYYHVVTGRVALVPILIISLTGSYLTMEKLGWLKAKEVKHDIKFDIASVPDEPGNLSTFDVFKNTKLSDVQKIQFPFVDDDPEEFFTIKLKEKELVVEQFSGRILSEIDYSKTSVFAELSLNLHTGRTSIIWAVVLGLACINILFFIYSGFAITLKRKSPKIENKANSDEAEYIILFGSESGTTSVYANIFHEQLVTNGVKSFIAELNTYKVYPAAKEIIIFTSTYGQGDPPPNATKFLYLIDKYKQSQNIIVSVVGFGSYAYLDFCGYAFMVENELRKKDWANVIHPTHTISDKSLEDLSAWAQQWSERTQIPILTSPAIFETKPTEVMQFKVIEKTLTSNASDCVFIVTLKPKSSKAKIRSGDLLAIYPADDHRERFYSIGMVNKYVQLVVRLQPNGLGSGFLDALKKGDIIKGKIVKNDHFYMPQVDNRIAFIGNGTGIAPFLGMIYENETQVECRLYCGFRRETNITERYYTFLREQETLGHLDGYEFAFSREENKMYVMDLLKNDAKYIAELLAEGGLIMICGSLAMQKDVEETINNICLDINTVGFDYYKAKGQLRVDCY